MGKEAWSRAGQSGLKCALPFCFPIRNPGSGRRRKSRGGQWAGRGGPSTSQCTRGSPCWDRLALRPKQDQRFSKTSLGFGTCCKGRWTYSRAGKHRRPPCRSGLRVTWAVLLQALMEMSPTCTKGQMPPPPPHWPQFVLKTQQKPLEGNTPCSP